METTSAVYRGDCIEWLESYDGAPIKLIVTDPPYTLPSWSGGGFMDESKRDWINEMDVDNPVIEWHLPWITIENENGEPQDCLLLSDRDIEYVYEGYEKEETVIVPPKKKLVLRANTSSQ